MPRYLYITADGEHIEHVCSWQGRPDTITLPDGRSANYDFYANARTQSVPQPALDTRTDAMSYAVHPEQADEYNRVARSIGISGTDAHWDDRGNLHVTRTGLKKLHRAEALARQHGADPEFDRKTETQRKQV